MKITVALDSNKSSETAAAGTTVGDLMKKRKLNPQLFIALKNGSACHEKDEVQEGDSVAFVKLIYGG